MDYFTQVFPHEAIERLVTETNRYAAQCQITKSLPRVKFYWSTNKFLGKLFIFIRYLHVNDKEQQVPYGQQGYNPIHKVQPLVDIMKASFSSSYDLDRDLAIDEAIVDFKGRSHLKMYLPSKPVKWGFKVWTLAESKSGYVADFNIYTGKHAAPSAHGLGYDVIDGLGRAHYGQFRHLYFDKFFSSIHLMDHLLANNTYACGMIRANRRGLPQEIKTPGKMKQGDAIMQQRNHLVATVWHDKKDIRMVSTNCQPAMTTVPRRVNRVVQDIPCPVAVTNYNHHIGHLSHITSLHSLNNQYRVCIGNSLSWKTAPLLL